MFEILLLDLDDTILDFHMQEAVAIRKTLRAFGVDPTDEVCTRYSQINEMHWKRLERGEITRDQVLHGRFEVLFAELGIQQDPVPVVKAYTENLSEGHFFLPGAFEAVQKLQKKYRLFLVSNGTAAVQMRRLESAGLIPCFEGLFISQTVGVNKPAKGFFDYCFANIAGFAPEKTMIVGDSLSSDILGGQNGGISTCWVNPKHKVCTLDKQPDYQIESITQLENLLSGL